MSAVRHLKQSKHMTSEDGCGGGDQPWQRGVHPTPDYQRWTAGDSTTAALLPNRADWMPYRTFRTETRHERSSHTSFSRPSPKIGNERLPSAGTEPKSSTIAPMSDCSVSLVYVLRNSLNIEE